MGGTRGNSKDKTGRLIQVYTILRRNAHVHTAKVQQRQDEAPQRPEAAVSEQSRKVKH